LVSIFPTFHQELAILYKIEMVRKGKKARMGKPLLAKRKEVW